MKLDHDLIRQILLQIEESNHSPLEWMTLKVAGRSDQELSYHVHLLAEAGFIEAQDLSTFDGHEWQPKRLTYAGHELIEAIREQEIWNQTKEAAKQGGAKTLEFLWEISKAIGKNELKKRTGLEF